jgi:transposase-like protein
MNRMDLLYKMDDLLKNCKVCEHRDKPHNKLCAGCSTYNELQAIGEQLGEERRMKLKDFTEDEYQDLKAKGLSDSAIAKRKGVTSPALSSWKKSHKKRHLKPVIDGSKPKETNTPKEVKQPLQDGSQSFVNTLKREKEVMQKGLDQYKEEIENLKITTVPRSKYNDLETDYKEADLERIKNFEEYKKMEEAYHKEHSIRINLDQELENVREQLRQLREEIVKLGQENEHLKGLVKLWM